MDRLALAGAEIAFLLASVDEDRRRRAWTRLQLPEEARTDAAIRAGLSSLVARGLVTGSGTEITLSPPVAAVLNGLTEATVWRELAVFTSAAVDLAQLYVHDRGAFLLSPRAYTTFDVRGLRAGVDPAELLVSLARGFLTGDAPALVACRDGAGTELAVAASGDGTYSFSGGSGAPLPAATLDDALRLFGSAIAPATA